jgi:hypothetical protein
MTGTDKTDIFWPPLNPDPDCPRCGGTGYSRARGDNFDTIGRCQCNVDRLEATNKDRVIAHVGHVDPSDSQSLYRKPLAKMERTSAGEKNPFHHEQIMAAYYAALSGRDPAEVNVFELLPLIFERVPDTSIEEIAESLRWSARQDLREADQLRRFSEKPSA